MTLWHGLRGLPPTDPPSSRLFFSFSLPPHPRVARYLQLTTGSKSEDSELYDPWPSPWREQISDIVNSPHLSHSVRRFPFLPPSLTSLTSYLLSATTGGEVLLQGFGSGAPLDQGNRPFGSSTRSFVLSTRLSDLCVSCFFSPSGTTTLSLDDTT